MYENKLRQEKRARMEENGPTDEDQDDGNLDY